MPTLLINEPTKVRFIDFSDAQIERIRRHLSFKDSSANYVLQQHLKNFRWKRSDPIAWDDHKSDLEQQINRCILFKDDESYWTYSGLAHSLTGPLFGDPVIINKIEYPEIKGIAWHKKPENQERYYQIEAEKELFDHKHGNIEIPTGSGKSRILLDLVKKIGLKTLLLAPSSSILTQLVKDFKTYLGERYVGQYGDGKKQIGKLVTIATYQSVVRIEKGTPIWDDLSKIEVFLVDESHLTPATTLEGVCLGIAKDAKYRFFVSATQTRSDGYGPVLKGVIGPSVYTKPMNELVDEGFLAKPHFKIISVKSQDSFDSQDVAKMTRHHLLYNPEINKLASQIANNAVSKLGHKVLIQIDEISQFQHLLRHLEFEPRFAHGASKSDKDLRSKIPEKYWDSNPSKLVDGFNNEEFPILIGTSCVGMGTDFKVPETIINLMGGISPIAIPQAVGRGTRRHKFLNGKEKTAFNFIDFCPLVSNHVYNDGASGAKMSPVYRHSLSRIQLYKGLYDNVKFL